MSRADREQFEQLLAAHAGRTLTVDEDLRLRELAAADPASGEELAGFDDVHQALDAECALFAAANAPLTAVEESDEGFARLAAAAASAEDGLRAQLRFAPLRSELADLNRRGPRRGLWLAVGAAAAVLVVALVLMRGDGAPELLMGDPGDRVLGGTSRILMQAELRADRPVLSWHAVVGASRYDALVEDQEGELVLARSPANAGSVRWELTSEQFRELSSRAALSSGLRLRIVARDGAGLAVGTSGDLPLRIVE